MPWMETNVLEERYRFVCDFESRQWSMTELCERYGISRPTGYKWIVRAREPGESRLEDRSRAPLRCPHRTTPRIVELILSARKKYGWGSKKLLQVLAGRHRDLAWPARSTVNDILERHGLLRKNRQKMDAPGSRTAAHRTADTAIRSRSPITSAEPCSPAAAFHR
jgi:putative transposase